MRKTKTLSASIEPGVYERLQWVAASTQRSQSSIIASALKLYTALPLTARRALDDLETADDPETAARLTREIQRVLLRIRWEMMADQINQAIGDDLPETVSEADLMEMATAAVRESRRVRGAR